jgi:hypothetical protein
MEKKLIIDPEIKKLIPPLSKDEYAQLERNLITSGYCRDAVTVWKGIILDGHHRHEICERNNIPYEVTKVHFNTREHVVLWIINNQLGRRNLSDAMRIELAVLKTEMLHKKAKENQSKGGGDTAGGKKKPDETVNIRKAIAGEAGVSEGMVYRYVKIKALGDPLLLQQVKNGEIKIGTAYRALDVKSRAVTPLLIGKPLDKNDPIRIRQVQNRISYIDRLYQNACKNKWLEVSSEAGAKIYEKVLRQMGTVQRLMEKMGM